MGEIYDVYWGKADPEIAGFHLAAYHALDVAAVALRRMEHSDVLRSRLAVLLGIPAERVAPTVAALIALHDIGKLDVRFQLKRRDVGVALDPRRDTCCFRGSYDHGAWGYHQLRREIGGDVQAAFGVGMDPLLQAVTGHHGELPSRARRRADEDIEPFEAGDRAARSAFVKDVARMFRARGAALPRESGEPSFAAVALVAGLCSVADWIGSQVDRFPYVPGPMPLNDYLGRALAQADAALDAMHPDAPPSGRGFAELFPRTPMPRDVQLLTEALAVTAEPRLIVIEAPMGAGKTEAALSLSERLIAARAASGLFFALPTMATSNGLFARVTGIVPRMFTGQVNLLLAHSRARRSDAMRRLVQKSLSPTRARYGGRAPGGTAELCDEEASAVCAKWYLSAKRALVSQVGVGTVDQAMVAALRVRHHFVRLYGLATSVVVLDEIHAYDAYMSVVLERLVEWLGALRAPVILLSATLPAERRCSFETAYARGAFGAPPAGEADGAPYPLVSVVEREGRTTSHLPVAPAGYDLAVEHVATHDPLCDVLPRLVEASRGGRVAWIRNTVSEAQEAWEAARATGVEATLFHARVRARDRARAEKQVLRGFGRGGKRDAGLVIATQVIEQSLDLDFDLVASDLAPIDLLLQRAGRMHRHLDTRPRPAGFDRRLLVVTPPPAEVDTLGFGPSRYVYDPVTLWLAHELVLAHPRVSVPRDMRALIEASYDPAERAERLMRASNARRLAEAEQKREERRRRSEQHAMECAIPPASYDPGRVRASDDDDAVVQSLTREGDSVTLLPILWADSADVATTLDAVPLVLDAGQPQAFREAVLLQDEQITVPAYRVSGEATARGDARAYERWRERAHAFAEAMRVGRMIIVPMTVKGGVFSGRVLTRDGPSATVRYTIEKGLWFP